MAVIPTAPKFVFDINKQALQDALKQVIPFAAKKSRAVEMIFKDGTLNLRTRTPDVGEGKASVPCTVYPKPFTVVLNPDYILDYLDSIPEGFDTLKVSFKEKGDCTLWTIPTNVKSAYALMPLTFTI
jgi:DNA polymerase III sliding clamp (beta) subunit (PCNA family)